VNDRTGSPGSAVTGTFAFSRNRMYVGWIALCFGPPLLQDEPIITTKYESTSLLWWMQSFRHRPMLLKWRNFHLLRMMWRVFGLREEELVARSTSYQDTIGALQEESKC
jgi:hypothetical protein